MLTVILLLESFLKISEILKFKERFGIGEIQLHTLFVSTEQGLLLDRDAQALLQAARNHQGPVPAHRQEDHREGTDLDEHLNAEAVIRGCWGQSQKRRTNAHRELRRNRNIGSVIAQAE